MFHIGQKVIKVVDWSQTNSEWRGQPIQKGEIHTVRKFFSNACAIYLEGISNPLDCNGLEYAYDATEWAPYNPPAEYIAVTFSDIKEPAPCAS